MLYLGLNLLMGVPGAAGASAPVNTVAPAVTGDPIRGQTLSCSEGTWSGEPTGYTYQWRRDGEDIVGETNDTYLLTATDVGTDIDCVVTATNDEGSDSADSNDVTITALPAQSHDFERSSSQFLSITDANFGAFNLAMFAISVFVKRESASGSEVHTIMSQNGTSGADVSYALRFNNDRVSFITSVDGSTVNGEITSTATITDTNWHHILVHFDSANATAGDRMRMWIDGTEVTAFDADTTPSASARNGIAAHRIGAIGGGGSTTNHFDGLMYNLAFFSGALPAVTVVRNATTGEPVDVTGATGLHAWLDFADDSLISDGVLVADWTNNATVTASASIPF